MNFVNQAAEALKSGSERIAKALAAAAGGVATQLQEMPARIAAAASATTVNIQALNTAVAAVPPLVDPPFIIGDLPEKVKPALATLKEHTTAAAQVPATMATQGPDLAPLLAEVNTLLAGAPAIATQLGSVVPNLETPLAVKTGHRAELRSIAADAMTAIPRVEAYGGQLRLSVLAKSDVAALTMLRDGAAADIGAIRSRTSASLAQARSKFLAASEEIAAEIGRAHV